MLNRKNLADFDRDDDGITPLMLAIEGDAPRKLVELLITSGALVNDTDYARDTALHVAAHGGKAELARVLLDRGADSMLDI